VGSISDDLIEAICRTYDRLPDEMQARLPLKPVWVVVEND
jgi:predicted Mrr-cat superfamily restriction endonuclease